MIIIDSNYFYSIFEPNDALHLRAVKFKDKIFDLPILYLEDVLKEVQTIISVRKSHKACFDWIDSIYRNETDDDRQYTLMNGEYFEILNFWRELGESRLSFVDAEILYIANKYKYPVLTFDDELIKRLPSELVFN